MKHAHICVNTRYVPVQTAHLAETGNWEALPPTTLPQGRNVCNQTSEVGQTPKNAERPRQVQQPSTLISTPYPAWPFPNIKSKFQKHLFCKYHGQMSAEIRFSSKEGKHSSQSSRHSPEAQGGLPCRFISTSYR